jgi:archaellum biogenesis ATPase FlaH
MNEYVELVLNDVTNRGHFIPLNEINRFVSNAKVAYRSTFLYQSDNIEPDSVVSPSRYMGDYNIDTIILDIDKGEDSIEELCNRVLAICLFLQDKLGDYNFIPLFSGTGFHIVFSSEYFGFTPSPDLPNIVRATVSNMFPEADGSVYIKTGIYRLTNTINPKTNLYKIPVTIGELSNPEGILELAKRPRRNFDWERYNLKSGDRRFSDKIIIPISPIIRTSFDPIKIATCINTILNNPPQTGCRHITIMRLASHFRRHGFPLEICIAGVKHWLERDTSEHQFTDEELRHIVSNTYNKGYRYGCNDEVLQSHCSPQCIYYTNRDYDCEVLDYEQMHNHYITRLGTNYSYRTLNLDVLLNTSNDARVYPGELVTVFGLTGVGKTAFMQNVCAGFDVYGHYHPECQLPTLFITMEMTVDRMYRRWLQIVLDKTKEQVNEMFRTTENAPLPQISNILLRILSPSLEKIEEEIKKYEPRLVVVDYIELLDVGSNNERYKIKTITRRLKQLAINMDVIIVQLSQVSRSYSRAGILDLYAGRESGSIESDSDKVIGIWGSPGIKEKKIEFFKNRDGEYLNVQYVKSTNSFRFLKCSQEDFDNSRVMSLSSLVM